MLINPSEDGHRNTSNIETFLRVLDFGFRELEFADQVSNRISCETESEEKEGKRVDAVNDFRDVLLVI